MGVIGIALIALLAGQSYASVFLSTLPHTGLDGTAYVAFWTVHVNLLLLISLWILEEKVRSRALIFVVKYYYFLVGLSSRTVLQNRPSFADRSSPRIVYQLNRSTSCEFATQAGFLLCRSQADAPRYSCTRFYRNLFARLNSLDQFALIQLLSSFWVCIWYPFSMTPLCHKIVSHFLPEPKSWEEWVENIGICEYGKEATSNRFSNLADMEDMLVYSFLSAKSCAEHYDAGVSGLGLYSSFRTKPEYVFFGMSGSSTWTAQLTSISALSHFLRCRHVSLLCFCRQQRPIQLPIDIARLSCNLGQ